MHRASRCWAHGVQSHLRRHVRVRRVFVEFRRRDVVRRGVSGLRGVPDRHRCRMRRRPAKPTPPTKASRRSSLPTAPAASVFAVLDCDALRGEDVADLSAVPQSLFVLASVRMSTNKSNNASASSPPPPIGFGCFRGQPQHVPEEGLEGALKRRDVLGRERTRPAAAPFTAFTPSNSVAMRIGVLKSSFMAALHLAAKACTS